MLVKNVFAYTVLLILLTTVIFIFIDDFTFTLKPVENEFKKEENNYNLPKALGIALAITFVFILIKEKLIFSSYNMPKNNSNNNIIKKITNNKKITNDKNIYYKKINNNNFNTINNNINRLLKKLKKN